MPRTSAIITIVSRVLILIGGTVVYFLSRRQNEHRRHLFSAHNVGEIMFNVIQFPPLLLKMEIQQSSKNENVSAEQRDDLHTYKIIGMTLQHQTDTTETLVQIHPAEIEV